MNVFSSNAVNPFNVTLDSFGAGDQPFGQSPGHIRRLGSDLCLSLSSSTSSDEINLIAGQEIHGIDMAKRRLDSMNDDDGDGDGDGDVDIDVDGDNDNGGAVIRLLNRVIGFYMRGY